MDDAIAILGTQIRLGLDPILGFLAPGLGDGISAATQRVLPWSALRARVPRATLVRMVVAAVRLAFVVHRFSQPA